MIEQWYELTLEPGPRPALVLDASESAQRIAPYLSSLTVGLLELMPESSWPRIFFLGGSTSYDPGDFASHGEDWFRSNSGRGSFLTPVLEALADEPDLVLAVAGSGRIFDLPDWRGHPLLDNAVWTKVGAASLTDGAYDEQSYTCEQLAERLTNPLSHIEIGGAGCLPVRWDDAVFRLEGHKLVGARTSGRLRLGMLNPAQSPVAAEVIMRNGTRRSLRVHESSALALPEWVRLPHAEFMLVRQCLSKGRFLCPNCQQEHAAGSLRCPRQESLPIFPTLDRLPAGFALIDSAAWETRVRSHPAPVLQLSDETAALRDPDGGGAQILRYDPELNEWQRSGGFAVFHELQDKLYAMVL